MKSDPQLMQAEVEEVKVSVCSSPPGVLPQSGV